MNRGLEREINPQSGLGSTKKSSDVQTQCRSREKGSTFSSSPLPHKLLPVHPRCDEKVLRIGCHIFPRMSTRFHPSVEMPPLRIVCAPAVAFRTVISMVRNNDGGWSTVATTNGGFGHRLNTDLSKPGSQQVRLEQLPCRLKPVNVKMAFMKPRIVFLDARMFAFAFWKVEKVYSQHICRLQAAQHDKSGQNQVSDSSVWSCVVIVGQNVNAQSALVHSHIACPTHTSGFFCKCY